MLKKILNIWVEANLKKVYCCPYIHGCSCRLGPWDTGGFSGCDEEGNQDQHGRKNNLKHEENFSWLIFQHQINVSLVMTNDWWLIPLLEHVQSTISFVKRLTVAVLAFVPPVYIKASQTPYETSNTHIFIIFLPWVKLSSNFREHYLFSLWRPRMTDDFWLNLSNCCCWCLPSPERRCLCGSSEHKASA